MNRTDETSRIVVTALAVLVSVPLGIWAFQMVLEKKFQEAVKKAKETPDTGKPIRDFDLE